MAEDKKPQGIRRVHCRALQDFDTHTHCCKKGVVFECDSDLAVGLCDSGKAVLISESAAVKYEAERREALNAATER